ncbi:MAG: oxidoreductase-like domain-containing protein [Solimonas sp.]
MNDDAIPDRLPPQPDMPDCCDSGCAQCVLDDYAEEMRAWRNACASINAQRVAAGLPALPC